MLLVPLTNPHSSPVVLPAAYEPKTDTSKCRPLLSAFLLWGFWGNPKSSLSLHRIAWKEEGAGRSVLREQPPPPTTTNSQIPGLWPPSNKAASAFFDNLISWRRQCGLLQELPRKRKADLLTSSGQEKAAATPS